MIRRLAVLPTCCRSLVVAMLVTAGLASADSEAFAGEGAGRTWHVAQQPLPGIADNAQFRTISEAAVMVQPGDTVMVHGGTYRERVVVTKSGTTSDPIRFAAMPGEHVVVTGADLITAWEKDPELPIYNTRWDYRFEPHPNERYRREQIIMGGYELRQVLGKELLAPGTFFVDAEAKLLYVMPSGGRRRRPGAGITVEAATRTSIWEFHGDYLQVSGLDFRYAANQAQVGAAIFEGNKLLVSDCTFERTAGSGASFYLGSDITVERCTFADNGQLGFGAARAWAAPDRLHGPQQQHPQLPALVGGRRQQDRSLPQRDPGAQLLHRQPRRGHLVRYWQ